MSSTSSDISISVHMRKMYGQYMGTFTAPLTKSMSKFLN